MRGHTFRGTWRRAPADKEGLIAHEGNVARMMRAAVKRAKVCKQVEADYLQQVQEEKERVAQSGAGAGVCPFLREARGPQGVPCKGFATSRSVFASRGRCEGHP